MTSQTRRSVLSLQQALAAWRDHQRSAALAERTTEDTDHPLTRDGDRRVGYGDDE
jgi:hypothetical protein